MLLLLHAPYLLLFLLMQVRVLLLPVSGLQLLQLLQLLLLLPQEPGPGHLLRCRVQWFVRGPDKRVSEGLQLPLRLLPSCALLLLLLHLMCSLLQLQQQEQQQRCCCRRGR